MGTRTDVRRMALLESLVRELIDEERGPRDDHSPLKSPVSLAEIRG